MKILLFASVLLAFSMNAHAELAAEPVPNIASLPDVYPDTWIFAHDVNFDALIAGRVLLVDVAAKNKAGEVKGMMDAGQFASFAESKVHNELYVAETFYSRVTRGERTDAITVYDKANLARTGEIPLPGGKRALIVANEYTLQLIDNDRLLLVFNFTPAASVTVIDVASRAVVAEHQIAGCGMIFPVGRRGFSTLCSDGSVLTIQLGRDGSSRRQTRTEGFFDVDVDPIFDKPVYLGTRAYFPSFRGDIYEVDMRGSTPVFRNSWSLVNRKERREGWRPGGWEIIAGEGEKRIYVLMHSKGTNGSHKSGGTEVWVYDVGSRKRSLRVQLKTPGFSIEIVESDPAYLVVNNLKMELDIYRTNGEHIRTLQNIGNMPISLHAKR